MVGMFSEFTVFQMQHMPNFSNSLKIVDWLLVRALPYTTSNLSIKNRNIFSSHRRPLFVNRCCKLNKIIIYYLFLAHPSMAVTTKVTHLI